MTVAQIQKLSSYLRVIAAEAAIQVCPWIPIGIGVRLDSR
jgi:hypothetical protein